MASLQEMLTTRSDRDGQGQETRTRLQWSSERGMVVFGKARCLSEHRGWTLVMSNPSHFPSIIKSPENGRSFSRKEQAGGEVITVLLYGWPGSENCLCTHCPQVPTLSILGPSSPDNSLLTSLTNCPRLTYCRCDRGDNSYKLLVQCTEPATDVAQRRQLSIHKPEEFFLSVNKLSHLRSTA